MRIFNFLRRINPVEGLFNGLPRPDFNFKGFFYDKEFVEYSGLPGSEKAGIY
jgi:hypothetical protein